MKRLTVWCIAGLLVLGAQCGFAQNAKKVNVAVSLAASTDYYIGTMVGGKVADAFRQAGATVDILDGGNVVSTQIQQIQNAVVKGANIIYVFPIGGAEAYGDVLRAARKAGVKVIVSNNNPGQGAYDAYVGSEEFYMGAMMDLMVTDWINKQLRQAKSVKALILEARYNETMAHRCLGMRLIAEKFLRKANLQSMYFVRTAGPAVSYKDPSGKLVKVDEPTGGLILDKDGLAILNPFYDPRVVLIENSNRTSTGVTPTEAQAALEAAVTNGANDIQVVMAYGGVGIEVSQKVMEMSKSHALKNDLSHLAVFCSDATETNMKAIAQSANNSTVLRGVMAAGDLVGTVCEFAKKMVRGEWVPTDTMEPLSYVTVDAAGKLKTVMYTDVKPVPAPIEKFF